MATLKKIWELPQWSGLKDIGVGDSGKYGEVRGWQGDVRSATDLAALLHFPGDHPSRAPAIWIPFSAMRKIPGTNEVLVRDAMLKEKGLDAGRAAPAQAPVVSAMSQTDEAAMKTLGRLWELVCEANSGPPAELRAQFDQLSWWIMARPVSREVREKFFNTGKGNQG